MDCYLVTTEHLEDKVLFLDDEDFKVAMNYVPAVALETDVKMLAFNLMSNHMHFVPMCERADAESFINEFKRRYSYYFHNRYGVREVLRRVDVDIRLLPAGTESIERGIAYTQMNPVAARICQHPSLYLWGTGDAFFNAKPHSGTRLDELSLRQRRRLLHSKSELPGNLIVGEGGFILPSSYVYVGYVEKLFRTSERYTYFLNSSSKARKQLESTEALPAFRDHVISPAIVDLCNSLFRKQSLKELSPEEIPELLRQLRRRFSMDISQLSRLTGFSYADVARKLEEF